MPWIEGSSISGDRREGKKRGRSPSWSGNINNWDATAVTPSTSVHKQWTDTVPLSDRVHTPPSWASQARRHTHTVAENGSGGYTPKKSQPFLAAYWEREKGKNEKMERRRHGRQSPEEPGFCWGRTNLSSIPPPLSLHHQHPRLSFLKPFPCSFLLGSRPSRAAVLPSYLRLAGWLFVLAVGSGPGAGVVPQCVSVDGQVHRGLRRCRLRAPGLSVAKSGSNSRSGSSIRLSPQVGGASWLQLACRCDWQPRGQWQWQGPPPLLNSYPGDLRPSPSSLLYLLLGMCGRTRLLFPFHI